MSSLSAPSRFTAASGATLLIATSATLGSYYGYLAGSHHHAALGVVFAAAALGGELLKPFAISSGLQALASWQPLRALAALSVGLVCIVYSITSELSLAAGSRGDLAAERGAAVQARTDAQARREALQSELNGLSQARPSGELKALIDGVLANSKAGRCLVLDGPFTRENCPKVAAWRAELARAERRDTLTAALRDAETKLEGVPTVGAADPLAASLVAYAGALGWTLRADDISPWLALVPVVFLEIGSAFGLVVVRLMTAAPEMTARGMAATHAPPLPHRAPEQGSSKLLTTRCLQELSGESLVGVSGSGGAEPSSREKGLSELLRWLGEQGGQAQVSTRSLAAVMGVGKSTVHRLLSEAAARGVVGVTSGPKGSLLALSEGLPAGHMTGTHAA